MTNRFYPKGRNASAFGINHLLGKSSILILLSVFFSISVIAQEASVTGIVSDKSGEGLPGVTVQVKGTSKGTSTDLSGKYTLSGVPSNGILVFSFVGMTAQEVAVGGRSTLNITLADDAALLDEVVVVGYGTQKIKDATGAVATIGAKDFNKGVINNPEQLLQGRVAGVQMTPNSGEPGAGVNINIRGTTSIRGNNGPLYVVDGIPLDNSSSSGNDGNNGGAGTISGRNPLNFLNPADIENISVLKDASAAAIYGSRGANGVVLITTKTGKSGAGVLNFSTSLSASTPAKKYDLLSASEIISEFGKAGLSTSNPLINGGANTNWQDQIYRTGLTQNYNLSFGGGTEKTKYFFSIGYQDQKGIIKNTDQNKLTARINATHKLFDDKVTIGVAVTTTKIEDNQTATGGDIGYEGNVISTSFTTNPTFPIYKADGSFFTTGDAAFRTPVSLLSQVGLNTPQNRTLSNFYASWNIINGLTYKINFGLDNSTSNSSFRVDPQAIGFATNIPNNQGLAFLTNKLGNNTTLEHTLNYNKGFGKHSLDLLGGFAYYKYENSGNFLRSQYFVAPKGFPIVNNVGFVDASGSNKPYDGGSYLNQSELQSYFGRATYNYDGKYFLTGTLRADGSSKFGKNNKYGIFPSISGAWNIANEAFVPQNVFSQLKLRAGYGVTGNSEGFPINQSITTYVPNKNSGGISKENVSNPDLKWESTTAYNVGLDFGVLNGRLSGTVEYFHKGTDNLLFPLAAPQPDVATTKWANLPANIVNKGIEISVNYDILKGKKLSWDASFNTTFLKNEVQALSISTAQTGSLFGQGLTGAFIQPITVGYPLYSFFVPEFQGYDDKGLSKLSDDKKNFGSPFPKMTWGLSNNFSYGKWNASLFVNGQTGGYLFNNTALALFGAPAIKQGKNSDTQWLGDGQSYSDGLTASSKYIEKSDFVRLANLVIGYDFDLSNSKYFKRLGVSFTGQNLLLLTKYSGLDPEVLNPQAARNGIPSRGIDYLPYPKARTFTLGLNASF